MSQVEEKYIAHIRSSDKCEQLVQTHNNDVAALAGSLGKAYGIENLSAFCGRHHDDGKNTQEYCEYIKAASDGKYVVRGSVIHSTYGACIANSLANTEDLSEKLAAEMIRISIMSHHGLRDALTKDGIVTYQQAADRISSSYAAVEHIVLADNDKAAIKEEFERACIEAKQLQSKIIALQPKKNGLGSANIYFAFYERLLTSVLIDADRTDTACFEDNINPPERPTEEGQRKLWHGYRIYCDREIQKLQSKGDMSPLNQYRAEISEICSRFDSGANGIFRLVVPCGAGKTLSALRYALQTAEHYGKRHIFYVAPYNSILEQNANEIARYIGDEEAVLQHHSNVVLDEDDEESMKKYKLLTENWAQAPIIATSAVQFLNTFFASKTSAVRRMQALGDSVVIVDEIQALPIKTFKLFNAAMNFLAGFCNSSVLLCSATQPLLDELKEYKIMQPENLIQDTDKYVEAFKRVKIANDAIGNGFTCTEAANYILKKANEVKSLLAIVNTKGVARKIAKLIQSTKSKDCEYKIYHLSTNMCPAHRKAVINDMRDRLLDRKSKCKIICISTNLIEAGVDVSFEGVIRSLTGLDSIIQAAGRCNRNRETLCGVVSVIYIRDENMKFLAHIQKAQNITREILYEIDSRPELYPEGALSKQAMDEFYKKYYGEFQEKDMAFPLKYDPEHTIIDLLTTNPVGSRHNELSSNILLKQAFKEAGDAFDVIENVGKTDVIVEFDEDARQHIKKLLSSRLISEKKKELHHLQQYTVQLMPYTVDQIGAGIRIESEVGIRILSSEYYDSQFGVDDEPCTLIF